VPSGPLERLANGDSAAARDLISRYGGLVWSLARRMAASDAEDAVQEIFIEIWKAAPRFRPEVASEATFIAMIARRRLIDRRRRAGRQGAAASLEDSSLPAARGVGSPGELGEEAARAASALESLSGDQQRVIRLAICQGLSHEKTAEATGLPLGTVKTHIRRGLMKVRQALESPGTRQKVGAAT
jgi:RNA polymerase sigma factor (sigma-70 family)